MSNLTVDKILIALKATVYRNVNSDNWQDFGSPESYGSQLQQLTESIASSSFDVVLKALTVKFDS